MCSHKNLVNALIVCFPPPAHFTENQISSDLQSRKIMTEFFCQNNPQNYPLHALDNVPLSVISADIIECFSCQDLISLLSLSQTR